MNEVIAQLEEFAKRCDDASKAFDKDSIQTKVIEFKRATFEIGRAWSGSWLGYQAYTYKRNFEPIEPGEFFNTQWGLSRPASFGFSPDMWVEYSDEEVNRAILILAGKSKIKRFHELAERVESVTSETRNQLVPILDAVISDDPNRHASLKELRGIATEWKSRNSMSYFVAKQRPTKAHSSDLRALQGGAQTPPHIRQKSWLLEQLSTADRARELANIARRAVAYLRTVSMLKGRSSMTTGTRVFIGHGRSPAWKDLKEFIVERLRLEYEEFNRESVAGISTTDRLQEMLDQCSFAFLVMTAEDLQKGGEKHARQNVIHEAGLFQGRYGFKRAIILLESGCDEFSNIIGLGQIRFANGDITSEFEEIRRVLEREGLIKR